MHAMPLLIAVLCCLAIAYRYYSAFLAAKVAVLDDARTTPAHTLNDGQNYHPTHKWVLFGHHFAAISGAGPLIGPVLAIQFGYLPGLIWIVVGVCLGGAVQDMLVLAASVRRNGRSLAEIVKAEIGPLAGLVAAIAILFIVIIALSGLGIIVVKALGGETHAGEVIKGSSWGTFTIACTVPIALFVGLYMYKIRKGHVVEASLIGAVLTLAATVAGSWIPGSSWEPFFDLTRGQTIWAICIYGFVASVLPVWVLLCPRDYLSSFLKIGTIVLLVVAVMVANPKLEAPAVNPVFAAGGGPYFSGAIFPFCFICIMCGAISGFHSLVSSGTTPKMVSRESHVRPIGYGAMLIEGLVAVVALIAAASLPQNVYWQINIDRARAADFKDKLAELGVAADRQELAEIERQVGGDEKLEGRTGGAVTLAVGMSHVFKQATTRLMGDRLSIDDVVKYWYHFAIMFEALFILTTIDTGTRIARFLLQEVLAKVYRPFERPDWLPGAVISTAVVTLGWGGLIATGSIDTIWPMFGIANQMLAVIALATVTTVTINAGRRRYAWVTLVPMLFVIITTTTAAWQMVTGPFSKMFAGGLHDENWALIAKGGLNICFTVFVVASVLLVVFEALMRWTRPLAAAEPGK